MKQLIFLFTIVIYSFSIAQIDTAKANAYLDKAHQSGVFSQAWQRNLDTAIFYNPYDPYLWQQKSMPLFKQKKYELGMQYIDSAVKYDTTIHMRAYRAFILCIFQKSYRKAIPEFQYLESKFKDGNVMDHTFHWHLGICYLQLNQFDSAEVYFKKSIDFRVKKWNQAHHLEHFYLGIVFMEKGNHNQALEQLDLALKLYSQFSDAQFYKAQILHKLKKHDEALILEKYALQNLKNGMSINEDNSYYEEYPYQIHKRWLER